MKQQSVYLLRDYRTPAIPELCASLWTELCVMRVMWIWISLTIETIKCISGWCNVLALQSSNQPLRVNRGLCIRCDLIIQLHPMQTHGRVTSPERRLLGTSLYSICHYSEFYLLLVRRATQNRHTWIGRALLWTYILKSFQEGHMNKVCVCFRFEKQVYLCYQKCRYFVLYQNIYPTFPLQNTMTQIDNNQSKSEANLQQKRTTTDKFTATKDQHEEGTGQHT